MLIRATVILDAFWSQKSLYWRRWHLTQVANWGSSVMVDDLPFCWSLYWYRWRLTHRARDSFSLKCYGTWQCPRCLRLLIDRDKSDVLHRLLLLALGWPFLFLVSGGCDSLLIRNKMARVRINRSCLHTRETLWDTYVDDENNNRNNTRDLRFREQCFAHCEGTEWEVWWSSVRKSVFLDWGSLVYSRIT